jgi:hypothetical protein
MLARAQRDERGRGGRHADKEIAHAVDTSINDDLLARAFSTGVVGRAAFSDDKTDELANEVVERAGGLSSSRAAGRSFAGRGLIVVIALLRTGTCSENDYEIDERGKDRSVSPILPPLTEKMSMWMANLVPYSCDTARVPMHVSVEKLNNTPQRGRVNGNDVVRCHISPWSLGR